jgi:integrase
MRNDFTLFMREYPNGKKVCFYYAYDKDGIRQGPWTTKCLNKTAGRNYCHKLMVAGILIPNRNKAVTFVEYAKGFWERGSEYVKNQESRGDITDNYIGNCKKMVANQILPFFGDTPLEKITDNDVNKWLLSFRERKVEKNGKTEIVKYQNTYANTVFGTFNVMLAEAVRRGLLAANPCEKVRKLKNDRKQVKILTIEEVRKLFPANYKSVWGDRKIAYVVCRLASVTGMRIGEILGLRGEYVSDSSVQVCGQSGEKGYLPYTKNKENRSVPLIPEMIALLRDFKNGNGFVFSLDGGAVPVTQAYVRKAFRKALVKIGISDEEIKRRALTIHSWRHFLNTNLLNQGLSIAQVQGVTGHKSLGMTERYAHLEASQIPDVMKAQAVIAGTNKTKKEKKPPETGKAKTSQQGLTLVKPPRRKTA